MLTHALALAINYALLLKFEWMKIPIACVFSLYMRLLYSIHSMNPLVPNTSHATFPQGFHAVEAWLGRYSFINRKVANLPVC